SRVVLALGSNLGDRLAALQGALDALADPDALRLLAVSPVYETAPVGGPEQDDYLNAVAVAETVLAPEALLARAQQVEKEFHRVRDVRWGPRTLDVDIIDYAALVRTDPELTLPHPRAHERAFVLRPWADIDPAAVLPGRGAVRDLLAGVADQEVRRRDDLVLRVPRRVPRATTAATAGYVLPAGGCRWRLPRSPGPSCFWWCGKPTPAWCCCRGRRFLRWRCWRSGS